MADLIISKIFKFEVFTWGSTSFENSILQRTAYLKALREADKNNYKPLVKFARS